MLKGIKYLCLLILVSCSDSSKSKGIDDNMDSECRLKKIIGEWQLCLEEDSVSYINYNVCPKIIFQDRNFVSLIKPSNERQSYKWRLSSDTIFLTYYNELGNRDSNTSELFFDEKYLLEIKEKDNHIYLKLLKINRKCWYVLSR